jgi:hypothetical protein
MTRLDKHLADAWFRSLESFDDRTLLRTHAARIYKTQHFLGICQDSNPNLTILKAVDGLCRHVAAGGGQEDHPTTLDQDDPHLRPPAE